MLQQSTLKMIGQYGLATVATVVLSLVLYQAVIVPYQTAQEESRKEAAEERAAARVERAANAKALAESAKEVTKANQALAETNKSLADSYAKMADGFETSNSILRDMRDDQRKFPAVQRANAEPEPKPEQP